MRYLGLDVHSKATVWCLFGDSGRVVERGNVPTTAPELTTLVKRLRADDDLVAAQEVGTQSYFVHDVMTAAGVKLLSFNAQQLRMIASSRKKTDRRDAYWIAKALQTEMTPHPVYIPSGPVRRLRQQLSQREGLIHERQRWLLRAQSSVRAAGQPVPRNRSPKKLQATLLSQPDGLDQPLIEALERCQRMHDALTKELAELEAAILREAGSIDVVRRLQTIPGVGPWVALTIYAWVGDVSRFPNARRLTAYAGLVPSVWQSGDSLRQGGITKQGTRALRSMLVQAGHALLGRCRSTEAAALQELPARVHARRKNRKIAVVAAARHILKLAYYVLRDGTMYDPARLTRRPQLDAAE
jgi:transposase